eukprot:TRINITY_DN91962_c0_g1_i1.p1 TRINITY_DN91962_c0_g1~~TRINITY_DN91962_c0_g1_i1.p1  ORF type:complete len:240 (-),score=45.95 TRINITY_DN91962_c0_g1_i1:170-889(-)
MVSPANQFCCGCSIVTGSIAVLVLNVCINGVLFVRAAMAIFYPSSSPATTGDMPWQVFTAAFCLAGVPFMILGALGLARRDEVTLRAYYFYLALAVIIASIVLVSAATSTSCRNLPSELQGGGAFFCGIVEVVDVVLAILLVGNMIYALYIVWSLCQDFGISGSTPFSDLEASYGALQVKRLKEASHGVIRSLEDQGERALIGNTEGEDLRAMFGGSTGVKLFGYKHEMQFPPPHKTYH